MRTKRGHGAIERTGDGIAIFGRTPFIDDGHAGEGWKDDLPFKIEQVENDGTFDRVKGTQRVIVLSPAENFFRLLDHFGEERRMLSAGFDCDGQRDGASPPLSIAIRGMVCSASRSAWSIRKLGNSMMWLSASTIGNER